MAAEPSTLSPTSLVIADVAAFWAQVRTAMDQGPLIVDLAKVQRIDGAGAQLLQLLLSQGGSGRVTLQHPSPATITMARGLGLEAVAAVA